MWTGVSFTEITFVHKLKRRLDNFSFTSSCVRNLASSSSLMTSSPCLSIYLSITADAAQYHGPKNYSHSVTNLSMKLWWVRARSWLIAWYRYLSIKPIKLPSQRIGLNNRSAVYLSTWKHPLSSLSALREHVFWKGVNIHFLWNIIFLTDHIEQIIEKLHKTAMKNIIDSNLYDKVLML